MEMMYDGKVVRRMWVYLYLGESNEVEEGRGTSFLSRHYLQKESN